MYQSIVDGTIRKDPFNPNNTKDCSCLKTFGNITIREKHRNYSKKLKRKKRKAIEWYGIRCQSWTFEKPSEKMWKEYSYAGRSVCVAVELSECKSLHFNKHKVESMNVEYRNSIKVNSELKKLVRENNITDIVSVFQTKKSKFRFEREIRLYVLAYNNINGVELDLDDNNHYIDAISVPITYKLSDFIKQVYIHPQAPVSMRNEVLNTCDANGITFTVFGS